MSDQGIDLVVGGGVAGIAAALRLSEMGRAPTLVEKRPWLGGRATSFESRETGEVIDNGQHVVLGCCKHILDLLKTLQTDHLIHFSSTINWAMRNNQVAHLMRAPLPAPLHYMPSLMRLKALTLRERLRVMTAQSCLYFTSEARRLAWGKTTFDDWLSRMKQSANARAVFWEPIVVSALNEPMDECSAAAGIDLFKRAFLPTRSAAMIGVPKVSLRELIGEPAKENLTRRQGEVRLGVGVRSLTVTEGRVSHAVFTDGKTEATRSVTLAIMAKDAAKLLAATTPSADLPRIDPWPTDSGSPIICIHLWFRATITDLPHAILIGGLPQWFFAHPVSPDATRRTGAVQRLVAVVSAADAAMHMSNDEIVTQTIDTLRASLGAAAQESLLFQRVVREPRATFTLTPETEHLRPPQETAISNLHIAGDWTDSGWPSTLEGAAASAARVVYK